MRLYRSELSIQFDAKINSVNDDSTNILLTVCNNVYVTSNDKYLFSIYLYEQKEGDNSLVFGAVSDINSPFNLTRYQSAKGLSLEGISIQVDRKLNRLFVSGSPALGSVQTCEVSLYFSNRDEMDRCYGAILECFYGAMNFNSTGKLNVVEES